MAFVLLVVPFVFIPAINGQMARMAVASVAVCVIASNGLLPRLSYDELISSVQFDHQAYAGKNRSTYF